MNELNGNACLWHIQLLGKTARCRVTGFVGVCSSVCFDLYGCIQIALTPKVNADGKTGDVCWYDVSRLEILNLPAVMVLPHFDNFYIASGDKGPAEKPNAKA